MVRRLFLVGASGVGKTFLAQAVAPLVGVPYEPVSASEGYRHYNTTPEACFRDAPLMEKVQARIADYTAEALEALAPTDGYVTDRAFDLSVYGALLGYPHPKVKVARVLEAMRDPGGPNRPLAVTVVFVRPEVELIKKARAEDGGRRSEFLTDSWVLRLDGALCHFLRANFIPHVELPAGMIDIRERMRWVRDAVEATPFEPATGWVDPDGGIW